MVKTHAGLGDFTHCRLLTFKMHSKSIIESEIVMLEAFYVHHFLIITGTLLHFYINNCLLH